MIALAAAILAAAGFSENRTSPENIPLSSRVEGIFHPSFFVHPRITTAYLTSGKLGSNRPVFTFESGVRQSLGDFGYFGANSWCKNDLSRKFIDQRRDWANEIDYILYYGYKWNFAKGWALDSTLRYMWDVCYGNRVSSTRTLNEWRWRETLQTPWLDFYAQIRTFIRPVDCGALRLGVTKKYEIFDRVFITPDITFYGGQEDWIYYRFGYYTEEKPNYRIGPTAITAEINLSYKPTDNFEMYLGVGQWALVTHELRSQMKARKGPLGRRDLTYALAGLKISFP